MAADEDRPLKITFSAHTSWRFTGRRDIDPPRPLTSQERELLDYLLAPEFPGRDELRQQAQDVVVWGECTCGCRSMNLAVLESSPNAKVNARVAVEATYNPSPEVTLQVLLHVVEGRMVELEFVDFDTGVKGAFPPMEALDLFIPGVTKIWTDE